MVQRRLRKIEIIQIATTLQEFILILNVSGAIDVIISLQLILIWLFDTLINL